MSSQSTPLGGGRVGRSVDWGIVPGIRQRKCWASLLKPTHNVDGRHIHYGTVMFTSNATGMKRCQTQLILMVNLHI